MDDAFFLVMDFLLAGFFGAGLLAFVEGVGFFVDSAFGTEAED